MTESEFEEFTITLGMRYYALDHTAYGQADGFQMVLRFLQRQGRYVLLIGVAAPGIEEEEKLSALLKAFASDRSRVVYAQLEDNTIQVCMKMTVDSEIDRETIKDGIGAVFCFCKDLKISPICKYCGHQKKVNFYTLGGDFDAMCEDCFDERSRAVDIKLKKRNRKQKTVLGFLGSFIGCFLGAVIYIVLYLLGFKLGLGGIIIVLLSLFGFLWLGKRHSKKSVVICVIMSWIFLLCGEYAANIAEFAIVDLNAMSLGSLWALKEAFLWINENLLLQSVYQGILTNISIGTFLILIFGLLFAMIYKASYRPYIKSEKIE